MIRANSCTRLDRNEEILNAYIQTPILSVNFTERDTKGKGKVFYGQEPPSGESTTTECGLNYQLLAELY